MSETSRRNVIVAGAAGAAAGAAALSMGSASAQAARPHPARAREAVLALVEDHRGDTVTLLVGEREVVVRDRELVTRILNAAGGN